MIKIGLDTDNHTLTGQYSYNTSDVINNSVLLSSVPTLDLDKMKYCATNTETHEITLTVPDIDTTTNTIKTSNGNIVTKTITKTITQKNIEFDEDYYQTPAYNRKIHTVSLPSDLKKELNGFRDFMDFKMENIDGSINNLVSELNEVRTKADSAFQSASDGKTAIANAITGVNPNISFPENPPYDMLAYYVTQVAGPDTSDATATPINILSGKTAYVNKEKITGYMPNYSGQIILSNWAELSDTGDNSIVARITSAGYYEQGDPEYGGTGIRIPSSFLHYTGNITDGIIKAGSSIFGMAGTFTADGTAVAGDIVADKIAYVNGEAVTGTMPSKAAATITPGTADQTIASGQYLSGAQTVKGDTNLITDNIKSGSSIFGVTGKASVVDTADATAIAANILSGKTAYVNGVKITGSIPTKGWGVTQNMDSWSYGGSLLYAVPPQGYYDGTNSSIVLRDVNHLASNIKSDVSIYGVTGTLKDSKHVYEYYTSEVNFPVLSHPDGVPETIIVDCTYEDDASNTGSARVLFYNYNGTISKMTIFDDDQLALAISYSSAIGKIVVSGFNLGPSGNGVITYTKFTVIFK